jgi:hypothetical protein
MMNLSPLRAFAFYVGILLLGTGVFLTSSRTSAQFGPFPAMGPILLQSKVPKVLTFQSPALFSTAQTTVYTFNNVPIGNQTSDRIVYLSVSGQNTLTATVGGVATTQQVGTGTTSSYIHNVSMPTGGTTATIVLTFSGTNNDGVNLGVYTSTGVLSLTANATGSTTSNNTGVGVATLAGGFAIGQSASNGSATCSTTWTNMTSTYSGNGTGNNRCGSGAANTATNSGTTTFTANLADNGMTIQSAVYASW